MLVLLSAACGSDSPALNGQPPQNPGLEADKAAAREAVRQTFRGLPHNSPQEDNEQLAAYLQTQPIFHNVQLFPGLIWAEFPDGEPYFVMNNLPYVETDDPNATVFRAARTRTGALPLQSETAAPQSVAGKRCFLVNAFADNVENALAGGLRSQAGDSLGVIAGMLQSKNYTMAGPNFASYEAFRSSFQSVDVLVWCGHSAPGPGGTLLLTLTFDNIPSVENGTDPDVQGLPGQRLLLRGESVWGQWGNILHGQLPQTLNLHPTYAVTSRWLAEYVHLNERSLCLINACGSATDPAVPASLHPGTFVGWGGAPEISCQDMFATQEAFFDTALSLNQLQLFDSENPPRNDFQSVRGFLQQTSRTKLPAGSNSATHPYSLDTSRIPAAHGRNEIVSTLVVQGNGFLSPWIESAEVDSGNLILTGSFGDDPGPDQGKVTLADGRELTVTLWTPERIECAGVDPSAGGVVTVTCLDHPSNEKKLSGHPPGSPYTWAGDFVVTRVDHPGDSGSVTYTLNAHLVFHNQAGGGGLVPSATESTVGVHAEGTYTTVGGTVHALLPPFDRSMTVTGDGIFTHQPGAFEFTGAVVPSPQPGDPYGPRAVFIFDSQTSGYQFQVTPPLGAPYQESADVFLSGYPFAVQDDPLMAQAVQVGFDPSTYVISGALKQTLDANGSLWTLQVPTMTPTVP